MAEIRVERKERSVLPWILGMVLLALVVWGLKEMSVPDRNPADIGAEGAEAVGVQIPEQPPALRQYALMTVGELAKAA